MHSFYILVLKRKVKVLSAPKLSVKVFLKLVMKDLKSKISLID